MAALGGPTARRLGVGLATAVTLAMVVCTPILNPRPVDETVWIRREPPVLCDCPLTSSPAQIETDGETEPYPTATTAHFALGYLWTANTSGLLSRWDVQTGTYQQYHLPDKSVVLSLASNDNCVFAGSDRGSIWTLTAPAGAPVQLYQGAGRITALAWDGPRERLWAASATPSEAVIAQNDGEGIVEVALDGGFRRLSLLGHSQAAQDASRHITDLVVDPVHGEVWAGTLCSGILTYSPDDASWTQYARARPAPSPVNVYDLLVDANNTIWANTGEGLLKYQPGGWVPVPSNGFIPVGSRQAMAATELGDIWLVGQAFLARRHNGKQTTIYTFVENPVMLERVSAVTSNPAGDVWTIGSRGRIRFDGTEWTAYDADARRFASFEPVSPQPTSPPPTTFPSPVTDYAGWLRTWPRPAADNGMGLHFLQTHQFDEIEAQRQVNRLRRLGMRWTVVTYRDTDHLRRIAPIFRSAGIFVVWRPFIRPYEVYAHWTEDVELLRAGGMAPFMQVYNEPSLEQEWAGWDCIDRELFTAHLLNAVQRVYDAGGYVGLQFIDTSWLTEALRTIRSTGARKTMDRLFFIPHPYGLNHPPDYADDSNGVLGFRDYAALFQREIGYVPPHDCWRGRMAPG